MSTNSCASRKAADCINRILNGANAADFGFKTQAVAAHVLLRLGYRIEAVNQTGHPDIVAVKDDREFRFEVEAQVGGPHPRQLTKADFDSLLEIPDGFGYYALAIHFPTPYWVLVSASKLANRKRPCPNILLEALSDKGYSAEWTSEYLQLLSSACRQIRLASFNRLSELALAGRSL